MKKLLAATLLAASFATPALSADMAVKARPMAVVAAYDWSGLYVGGAMGGTWGKFDNDYLAPSVPVPPNSQRFSKFTGAALAGFQKQFGMWVLGGEFTWNSDINNVNSPIPNIPSIGFSDRIQDLATVGARVGYAGWTNFLVYGEGGYAQARVGYSEFVTATGAFNAPFSGSADARGWYAGAGVDYLLWKGQIADAILGAEYEHVGLQEQFDPSINSVNAQTYGVKGLDIARVRLTFKLNPWGTVTAPVVAKY